MDNGEFMYCLLQLTFIDWEILSALAAWAEILLIFIPAVYYFVRFKMDFVSYWIFEETSNGLKVAIHNKTKSSLFILHQELCVKKSQGIKKHTISMETYNETLPICVKPDEVIYIIIDYEIYNIAPSDHLVLNMQFAGKCGTQKKKIKRGNISCT